MNNENFRCTCGCFKWIIHGPEIECEACGARYDTPLCKAGSFNAARPRLRTQAGHRIGNEEQNEPDQDG